MMEAETKEKITGFLDYYLAQVNILDIHLPADLRNPQTPLELERRFNYVYVDQLEKMTQMISALLERPLLEYENKIVCDRLKVFLNRFGL